MGHIRDIRYKGYNSFFRCNWGTDLKIFDACHRCVCFLKSTNSSMDYPYAQVLEYRPYWLSISVVFDLKDILWCNHFVYDVNKERFNGTLKVVDFFIFSYFSNIDSYYYDVRIIFTTSPMWYGVGGFVGMLISVLPISWMCLILLNMVLFYCGFFLVVILSLRSVITWTLLNFPVSCWLEKSSMTCCNVVGYFS